MYYWVQRDIFVSLYHIYPYLIHTSFVLNRIKNNLFNACNMEENITMVLWENSRCYWSKPYCITWLQQRNAIIIFFNLLQHFIWKKIKCIVICSIIKYKRYFSKKKKMKDLHTEKIILFIHIVYSSNNQYTEVQTNQILFVHIRIRFRFKSGYKYG